MPETGGMTAIVMAGRREGTIDPLTDAAGLKDKCLVPVAGRPITAHVLAALGDVPAITRIIVSINDPALLDDVDAAKALRADGRLVLVAARTTSSTASSPPSTWPASRCS